jgi:L-ascorbate metabolism protein UlaG (beta-lactamase superfamily)
MSFIEVPNAKITWLGHATFFIEAQKKIYIDPFVLSQKNEKADIVLITHEHFDHCDPEKIKQVSKDNTQLFGPKTVIEKLGFGKVVRSFSDFALGDIRIEVVEAYNIGKPFHPKGLGVGYVIDCGSRIYHAGDTDFIPEMASLRNIDVALLPIGGKYTMDVADANLAVNSFKPKIIVPMHYNSDKYGISGINANPEDMGDLGESILHLLKPSV